MFAPGNYYHVYNRGVGRETIFFNNGNYEHCLRLAKKHIVTAGISIIAYCLMPNHYHFVLRQNGEKAVSDFIQVLFNAYVQAVNRQQNRSGTLFAGRVKHIHIDRDEYLIHVCRYIHANPVKAGLVRQLEDWPYSNYPEWLRARSGSLVDHELIDTYFPDRQTYRTFVLEYLQDTKAMPNGTKAYLLE